jgi:hypothetical protein
MVQVLVDSLEEVRSLVGRTVTSAAAAYEMLRPLGGLASDLTAVVRNLSARIHLIGLNAQVQAAQAAQDRRGAGLEVLSARTSEISRETNRISEEAATQLDAVAEGLAGSVKAFGQLRTDGLKEQATLNEQGRTHEQELHAFRDRALAELAAVGRSLEAIRTQARRTVEAARFTQFHQVTLPALEAPLAAIADAAERRLEGCAVAQHGSLIDNLKRHYTMGSEHRVFADVLSTQPAGSRAPSAEPAVQPEIELFTEPPAATNGGEHPAAEPKPEAALATAAAAAPGAQELGTNVELF